MISKIYALFLSLIISASLPAQFATEQVVASTLGRGQDVLTVDLDNDNDLDVFAATHFYLYWQPNVDGTGLFESPIIIDEGEFNFISLHADDLDNDGDYDVMAVSQEEAWAAYYENLGNGEFGPRTIIYDDQAFGSAVYTADINNDGNQDILTATRETSPGPGIRLRLFKNNGNLDFDNPQILTFIGSASLSTSINAGDLNGDGFIDLVCTNANSDYFRIGMNNGNETFTFSNIAPTDSNIRMHGSIIEDFDNDGALDLFYVDYYSAQVYLKNNGDGTFAEVSLPSFSSGIAGDALDYDNDGDVDIALVHTGSGNVQGGGLKILNNDGGGIFVLDSIYTGEGLENQSVSTGDVNNDGFVDAVSITEGGTFVDNEQICLYENNNGIDLLPVQSISESGRNISNLGLYDFNNDQIKDLYLVSIANQKITWMEGKGNNEFEVVHTVGHLNNGLGRTLLVDFDNDGDQDFVATNQTEYLGTYSNGSLSYFENDGMGNFSDERIFPGLEAEEDISNFQLSDFDQDGDMDLVVSQTLSPDRKLSISENLGNGNYGSLEEKATFGSNLSRIHVLDYDADGLEDIIVSETVNNGSIYWLKNQGGNNFANKEALVTRSDDEGFADFKIVDIDYDNDLDLATVVGSGQVEFVLYTNDGSNNFDDGVSLFSLSTGFSYNDFGIDFDIGDIDGDGDLDIVHGESNFYYFLQEADGSFSGSSGYFSGSEPTEVILEDLGNDGDLDCIVSHGGFDLYGYERISILESYANNASLNGFLFYDENSNGLFDTNEEKIPNQSLEISPAAIAAFTTDEGDYNFYVGEGEYTITPQLDECWTVTTTPVSYDVSTNGLDFQDGFNFGANLNGGDENVAIQMISAPTRCSFTVPFWLTATNNGCTVANGYAEMVLSDLATLQSFDPVPDVTIGDTLRWNYNDLFPEQQFKVELIFEIADASNIGSFIEMPLSTHYNDNGTITLGNQFLFESEINCAYDPNDKQVYPARTEIGYDDNYVIPDEPLLYTIRFQNTGTDTAFNIVIRDQLSTDLDWATFTPETASHAFESTLSEEGLVEFHFRDILLVDSFTNESASHGFVNFSIQPLSGLAENTGIENTAGIYFDFNAPIITNTVENIFVLELPSLLLPIAEFSVATNELAASFTNLSQNDPITSFWTFGDGNSSTDFSPMHTYTAEGEYEVCLTVTNAAGEDVTCENIQIMTSSINNTAINDNSYSLMPNPATERVQLIFERSLPADLVFECYTITGERVSMLTQIETASANLDVSQLPKGVYLLIGRVDRRNWLTDYFVVQ